MLMTFCYSLIYASSLKSSRKPSSVSCFSTICWTTQHLLKPLLVFTSKTFFQADSAHVMPLQKFDSFSDIRCINSFEVWAFDEAFSILPWHWMILASNSCKNEFEFIGSNTTLMSWISELDFRGVLVHCIRNVWNFFPLATSCCWISMISNCF